MNQCFLPSQKGWVLKLADKSECKHEEKFPMPDSLATVCEKCGQVWVEGEPWDYKSGNITEWLNDLYPKKEDEK